MKSTKATFGTATEQRSARTSGPLLASVLAFQLVLLALAGAEVRVDLVHPQGEGSPSRWAVANDVFLAQFDPSSGCLTALRAKAKDAWSIEEGTGELLKPTLWTGSIGTPGDYWFSPKVREPEAVLSPLADNAGQQLSSYGHFIWRRVQVRPDTRELLYSFRIPNYTGRVVEFELALEARLPPAWLVLLPGRPRPFSSGTQGTFCVGNVALEKKASLKSRDAFPVAGHAKATFPNGIALYSPETKTGLILRFNRDTFFGCALIWEKGKPLIRLVCPTARLRPREDFVCSLVVDVRCSVERADLPRILAEERPDASIVPAPVRPPDQKVLYNAVELDEILGLLRERDVDVLCDDPEYQLQGLAVKLGRRFGLSVSCQRYTYGNTAPITWPMTYREKPICVIGPPGLNPATTLVDRMAFTANDEFPGKGKGVIRLHRGLPMSAHPVVVVTGSDREGVRKAVELLVTRAGDHEPPNWGDFYIWAEDPMLWPHSYSITKDKNKLREMTVWAAKGERAIGRLLLRAERRIAGLKIEATPLARSTGDGALPPPKIRELRAKSDLGDGAFILDPVLRSEVPARFTRGYWLEFSVPVTASAGLYRGAIGVSTSDAGERALPVNVHVWDFSIPERSPIAVTMWNLFPKDGQGANLLAPDPSKVDADPAFRRLVANLRAHEVNVDSSFHPMQYCRWVENGEGEIEFDYTTFDRYMEFIEREGFDRGVMLYYVWHGRAGKVDPDRFVCLKYSPGRTAYLGRDGQEKQFQSKLEWAKVAQRYNRDFVEHLKSRGWYDRCFVVVGDEPGDYPRWRKEVLPYHRIGIKFITAMGHSSFGGEKYVDDIHQHWIVHQWHASGPDARPFVKRRYEQGDTIWWYECVGHPLVSHDLPPMRSFAYDLWREHIGGFGRYWYGGPLVCQKEEPRIRDIIGWELFRKGVEDYKFLWVLDSRIRMAKALGNDDLVAKARSEMDGLLTALPNTYQILSEPKRLDFLATRQQLAEMILALGEYAWNPEFYPWRQSAKLNWRKALRIAEDFAAGCPVERKAKASRLVLGLYELALAKHSAEIADRAVQLIPETRELAKGKPELGYVGDYLAKLGFEAAGIRMARTAALATETKVGEPFVRQGRWLTFGLRVINSGKVPLGSAAIFLRARKGVDFEPAAELKLGEVAAGAAKEAQLKIRFSDQFRESRFGLAPTLRYTRQGLLNSWTPLDEAFSVQLDLAVERAWLTGRSFRPLSLAERRFVNNVFPAQFTLRLRNNTQKKMSIRLRPKAPEGWSCEPIEAVDTLNPSETKEPKFELKLTANVEPPRGHGRVRLLINYNGVDTAQEFSLPYQRLQGWSLIGPFQIMPGLSTNFISYPGKPVDLARPYARPSGPPARWQPAAMEDELDFAYFFGKYADDRLGPLVGPNFAVAFAHAYFHSPRRQQAVVKVESDNKCTVWIDRKRVFPPGTEGEEEPDAEALLGGDEEEEDDDEDLELEDGRDRGVLLRQGWHEICVKCRKETEQSWKAKLIFQPIKAHDRSFIPPEQFVVQP